MEGRNVTQNRQRVEDLFSAPVDTQGNQVFIAPATPTLIPAQTGPDICGREIAGFDVVSFFAVSDQPFSIAVFESCGCCGPWVNTATLTSSVVDGQQVISVRRASNAKFMRLVVTNTGGATQTAFALCVFGIPSATAGA